jgi:hypothetical protein
MEFLIQGIYPMTGANLANFRCLYIPRLDDAGFQALLYSESVIFQNDHQRLFLHSAAPMVFCRARCAVMFCRHASNGESAFSVSWEI